MNLTLVAYYGEKPEPVVQLVTAIQEKLTVLLGNAFVKYHMAQVHGTIIGLEGYRVGHDILNTNYSEHLGQDRAIDFKKLFSILKDPTLLPFSVAIGGFESTKSYPFSSRGQHPYLRSFSIQGKIAVAMGWPCVKDEYLLSVDRLRRSLNEANVLHKYHAEINSLDNDFFFVLGQVDESKVDENSLSEAQQEMRTFLEKNCKLSIPIARENLSIIAYTDPTLPINTSLVYTLEDAEKRLDEIKGLYQE